MTDTGTSCIIGPTGETDAIINNILNQLPKVYTDSSWGYIFECPASDNDLPGFEFLFGDYWFEVHPSDYIIDISNNQDRSWCSLCLYTVEGFDEWILGDAFMRGWYNIHDHDNLRMGFVPFSGSAKSAAEAKTTTPSGSLPDVVLTNVSSLILGMESGTFILLFLVFFISTCCLACCLVYCMSVMFASKSSVLARGKKIFQKSQTA